MSCRSSSFNCITGTARLPPQIGTLWCPSVDGPIFSGSVIHAIVSWSVKLRPATCRTPRGSVYLVSVETSRVRVSVQCGTRGSVYPVSVETRVSVWGPACHVAADPGSRRGRSVSPAGAAHSAPARHRSRSGDSRPLLLRQRRRRSRRRLCRRSAPALTADWGRRARDSFRMARSATHASGYQPRGRYIFRLCDVQHADVTDNRPLIWPPSS